MSPISTAGFGSGAFPKEVCRRSLGLVCPVAVSPFLTVRHLARKQRSADDKDPLSRSLSYKVHIASVNNFPTAAGVASSASGYACLGRCPQGDLHSCSLQGATTNHMRLRLWLFHISEH